MTYIKSPLHQGKSTSSRPKRSGSKKPGPMSDAFSDPPPSNKDAKSGSDSKASAETEETPVASTMRLTVEKTKLPVSWMPKGAILRLNIFAELGFFLVLWAAYGFVMAYLPLSVQKIVAIAFSPWAIALSLIITGWLSARFLASLSLRFSDLQRMAWATQQLTPLAKSSPASCNDGDIHEAILDILFGAKESIAIRLNCLITLYCAMATYQLISLLY